MRDNSWKKREGVVFSTASDFSYTTIDEPVAQEALPPAFQRLRVGIDRSGRNGKTVTLVSGFKGSEDDLATLGKTLKTRLGVGGSAKDGEILIQGDFRDKAVQILISLGYTQTKRAN